MSFECETTVYKTMIMKSVQLDNVRRNSPLIQGLNSLSRASSECQSEDKGRWWRGFHFAYDETFNHGGHEVSRRLSSLVFPWCTFVPLVVSNLASILIC
jgi:hypothetical protein